jgi:hypothetical protein
MTDIIGTAVGASILLLILYVMLRKAGLLGRATEYAKAIWKIIKEGLEAFKSE